VGLPTRRWTFSFRVATARTCDDLHRPGYDAEASFSPDGKLIVFCSLRDAYPTISFPLGNFKTPGNRSRLVGEIYL